MTKQIELKNGDKVKDCYGRILEVLEQNDMMVRTYEDFNNPIHVRNLVKVG